MYKYLFETFLSVLWGTYPEVELLGHMAVLFLIVEEPPNRSPQQRLHFMFGYEASASVEWGAASGALKVVPGGDSQACSNILLGTFQGDMTCACQASRGGSENLGWLCWWACCVAMCGYHDAPCLRGGFGVGRGTRHLPDVTFLTLGL